MNKAAIRRLADDLVRHAGRYNQDTYGTLSECGTECCLAGFCLLRKVGARTFNAWVKSGTDLVSRIYGELGSGAAREAGIKTLGLSGGYHPIFSGHTGWPLDLSIEYSRAEHRHDHVGMTIVALKALQRLRPNGTIAGPRTVITRLPQLTALLKKRELQAA